MMFVVGGSSGASGQANISWQSAGYNFFFARSPVAPKMTTESGVRRSTSWGDASSVVTVTSVSSVGSASAVP